MNRTLFDDLEKANPKLLSRLPTGTTAQKSKVSTTTRMSLNSPLPRLTKAKRVSAKHFLDTNQFDPGNPIVGESSTPHQDPDESENILQDYLNERDESATLKAEVIELNRRAVMAYKAGLIKDCEHHLKVCERSVLKHIIGQSNEQHGFVPALLNLTIYNTAFFNLK